MTKRIAYGRARLGVLAGVVLLLPLALPFSGALTGAWADEPLRPAQHDTEVLVSWLVGTAVLSPEGGSIGRVVDLLLDPSDGSVTAAVIEVGGFLGYGAKRIAVRWPALDLSYDGSEIRLDLSRRGAEEAPAFVFRERRLRPSPKLPGDGDGDGGVGVGTEPPAAAPAD